MKLQITIGSPSPDLPEEVYNIDCPFDKSSHWRKKKRFKDNMSYAFYLSIVRYRHIKLENIETKYIN